MRVAQIRIAETGDVHTVHPTTPTRKVLGTMRENFNRETLKDIDWLILAGDFFDHLHGADSPEISEVQLFIAELEWICADYGIMLTVLRGTPSHDAGQEILFQTVKEVGAIPVDLDLVTTLSIKYIERFGIHVLYVPDEWHSGIEGTWLEIQDLLKEHGIEKVDFAVMHGAFTHQLPEIVAAKGICHDPERYLSIVKHYIFINHVHQFSQYQRILASGSPERLCHGDEVDKGHLRLVVRKDEADDIVFVKTRQPMVYKTVNLTHKTTSEMFDALNALVGDDIPAGSYIRVQANKHDPAIHLLKQIKQEYPLWVFTNPLVNKEATVQGTLFVDNRNRYEEITITPENLKQHLFPRIEGELGEAAQLLEVCHKVIDELL